MSLVSYCTHKTGRPDLEGCYLSQVLNFAVCQVFDGGKSRQAQSCIHYNEDTNLLLQLLNLTFPKVLLFVCHCYSRVVLGNLGTCCHTPRFSKTFCILAGVSTASYHSTNSSKAGQAGGEPLPGKQLAAMGSTCLLNGDALFLGGNNAHGILWALLWVNRRNCWD